MMKISQGVLLSGDIVLEGQVKAGSQFAIQGAVAFADAVTHQGAVRNSSTVQNTGAVTNASTVANQGAVTNSALVTNQAGVVDPGALIIGTAAYGLSASESGRVVLVSATSELTLPAAAAGLRYKIVRIKAAGGDVMVKPIGTGASDKIFGAVVRSVGATASANVADCLVVRSAGATGKGFRNIGTSAAFGDTVEVFGSTAGWFITAGFGSWASEA